mmetsp:Transcript_24826/g.34582  ORF Transcript_24826/g.34582 Transcript_24826/m.34582 type:complete len:142 (+) Transcript_24826:129-554(+)|eukprot:CAMPEP_0184487198 /NCGR_PEP_ID=MMETSP0113_2-20130426/9459_1 /TAXON_ID=91329 /ORGANISM="Norrisiella sphaerica, Strain BC52" /LENGTH=141 /DNA_ID=CAMNT_0026869403 /DNA_START=119 /DNA_END=544 /DNA_ORIENTATION=-
MSGVEEKAKMGEEKEGVRKKATILEMLKTAYERVPEHEKDENHPTSICMHLLENSPSKMLDVVSITMKSARGAGLAPGIKFPPGKSLMKACYQVYCEEHGKPEPISDAQQKKAAMENWLEMSQLLDKTLKLMFDKARSHLT